MICRHYGRSSSIEYLEHFCHANVSGVSMLGITEGAKHIGLNDMTVAASIIELNNITLPCILHWNQNHFVVLYKIKKGKKFYIADPAKGLVTYTLEPTPAFYSNKDFVEENKKRPHGVLYVFIINN